MLHLSLDSCEICPIFIIKYVIIRAKTLDKDWFLDKLEGH